MPDRRETRIDLPHQDCCLGTDQEQFARIRSGCMQQFGGGDRLRNIPGGPIPVRNQAVRTDRIEIGKAGSAEVIHAGQIQLSE
ncbi:hypothetical protein G6F65_022927 [Rhizopus arrhizus]|nr:hypothetical protein G6F24_016896 [Rhizopus arrhizus]KAG1242617.1 hypothetical protein G6F65_022927 [Rhizopus arrhizus]